MTRLLYVVCAITAAACEREPRREAPPGPKPPPPVKDPLELVADQIASKKVAAGDTAGVTVGIARNGKVAFVKGYGEANAETHTRATADTVYRIGQLTEQFTAAAILRLVEQDKLALDDDITKYVALPTKGRTITIRQLLRHGSGMPDYRLEGDDYWSPGEVTPAQIFDRIKQRIKDSAWDQDFYSSSEYVVLGLAIEKVTGEPYAQFVQREVIESAHLKHTKPCDTIAGPIAQAYRLRASGPVVAPLVDASVEFASASLCSTVPDVLAWWSALSSGQVVSAASYRMMITPEKADSVEGIGVIANATYGHRHLGGVALGQHGVELSAYPNDGLTVAVMSNTSVGLAESRIERALSMAAFGMPSKEVPLPAEIRDSLVGDYEWADGGGGGTQVRVRRGNLTIRFPAGFGMDLEYQGNDTFEAFDSPFTVGFHRTNGVVTGFTSHASPALGGDVEFVRKR